MQKRICVFCGSNSGLLPDYLAAAQELGAVLVRHNLELVYGGAHVGLMGAIANSVIQRGGQVIGVMPQSLIDREIAHRNLSELHIVQSMHERKARMAELADGFIALPGGFGTLEEFFEVVTWGQLGLHRKPFGLLNPNHFFDQLIGFLDFAASQQFIKPQHREMILVDGNPDRLLERFAAYNPPNITKWLNRQES